MEGSSLECKELDTTSPTSTVKKSTKPADTSSALVRIFPALVNSCGSLPAKEITNLQCALAANRIPPRTTLSPMISFYRLDGELAIQLGVNPSKSNAAYCPALSNPWVESDCKITALNSNCLQKMLTKPFKIFNVDDIPHLETKREKNTSTVGGSSSGPGLYDEDLDREPPFKKWRND